MGQARDALGNYPTAIGEPMTYPHEWAQMQRAQQKAALEMARHQAQLQQQIMQQATTSGYFGGGCLSGLYNPNNITTTTTTGTTSVVVTPGPSTTYDPSTGIVTFIANEVAQLPVAEPESAKEKSFAEQVQDELAEFMKK